MKKIFQYPLIQVVTICVISTV
uniref:Uncharacterized protein n=1 Tax=Arundo donax TaxID=35708 RepID=A0A0A9FYC0_ARUDO